MRKGSSTPTTAPARAESRGSYKRNTEGASPATSRERMADRPVPRSLNETPRKKRWVARGCTRNITRVITQSAPSEPVSNCTAPGPVASSSTAAWMGSPRPSTPQTASTMSSIFP
jgi:hypothetical protein